MSLQQQQQKIESYTYYMLAPSTLNEKNKEIWLFAILPEITNWIIKIINRQEKVSRKMSF